MRFTQAWANLAHSNSLLKIITIILGAFSILLGSLCIYLTTTPPLIVERGCHTSVINPVDTKPTEPEIKAFLIDALEARFNSNDGNLNLISVKELKRRSIERATLSKQGITQKLIVTPENISLDGSVATIKSDRLLSVGNIRSAFIFEVKVSFASTSRSTLNPYGLVVTQVTLIEPAKPLKEGEQ